MAGGSMKDIKRRIKSIESTGQITKAMELVASSKLRHAKERAIAAAPFFDELYNTICDISSYNSDFSSVYVQPREVKNSLFIIIAGDRGLAGGYNSNVLKLANKAMNGKNVKVLAIGKKAVDHYEKAGIMVAGFAGVAEDIDHLRVEKIAKVAIDMYKIGEVDEVFIYYTQFISALSQEALALKVLPLSDISENKVQKAYVEYEPSPEEVFDTIVPYYVSGIIHGSVVESYASEQGARRTAMESANDNAKDMIDKLSLSYNRARQAAITQEISEIVSGAGAAG
ncbi:MAG: ATP synthase F1 subunit gamma [Oscillospiraceae bacterium]